nr:GerAB/ArcD/ProY family transporter [Bacillus toyonensis]
MSALLVVVMLYTITYLICICVFSQSVVQELVYPVVELGKELEIGEFLERFDAFFYDLDYYHFLDYYNLYRYDGDCVNICI